MEKIEYIDRKTGEVILENPPGEGFLRFLYHHPFGAAPLHLLVKRKFVSAFYGRLMDRSNSREKIGPFVQQCGIDMNESLKSIEEFVSFNDFFYRELKPNSRDIQDGVVSPADGKIIAFEDIDDVNSFFVKGNKFTLKEFLLDEKLACEHKNSSLFVIRLAPNDYHRFHFPYDGKALESNKIAGKYFSVSPYAITGNFTKVFCENKREYSILKTGNKGDVLISPVGATMVGSIIESYQPGADVKKGDEMGYFAFGGSSVVMLVDKDKIEIDADILENTKKGMETSIMMGEKIGS
jgi:phosphatidylserine decarboxylase